MIYIVFNSNQERSIGGRHGAVRLDERRPELGQLFGSGHTNAIVTVDHLVDAIN